MPKNPMPIVKRMDELMATEIEERAKDYMVNSKARNTIRAYKSDWHDFEEWCNMHDFNAMPATPKAVGYYIIHLVDQGKKAATIRRKLASISQAHTIRKLISPTGSVEVKTLWSGIKRRIGVAQDPKTPILTHDLKKMVATIPDDLKGIRDKAILLLCFAGAFRRAELVSLNVEDVAIAPEGLMVMLRKSKTDQEKEGRKVGIPYGQNEQTCPVRAVLRWLAASGLKEGDPLFKGMYNGHGLRNTRLNDKMVALIIKDAAEKAGLNPRDFAGHSLRSGMATSAAANDASERSIMQQTGHRSTGMVRRYIRDARIFKDNAATKLGL